MEASVLEKGTLMEHNLQVVELVVDRINQLLDALSAEEGKWESLVVILKSSVKGLDQTQISNDAEEML